jgi:hypothetical protein
MDFPNYDELGKLLKHVGYRLVEINPLDPYDQEEQQPKNLKNY